MDVGGEAASGSALMVPQRGVLVETVLLSAREGRLWFRTVARGLDVGEHPDACARALAGLTEDGLLHSTSWRYAGDQVVLTYVGLPDPDPTAGPVLPVPDLAPVRGAGPLAPSPVEVRPVDVAVHACRHLAFLSYTDPVVAAHTGAVEVWDVIDLFTPALAGLFPVQ
jgi:hypothetical protein